MSEQLQLVIVRNPFDRRIRDERILAFTPDTTVQDIITHNLPMSNAITVAIDGVVIPANEWETCTLTEGQQLVVMPVVHDGDTLGSVLMLALAVFAAPIAGAAYGAMFGGAMVAGSLSAGLMTMGVMAIGSAVIGGLFPPQKPNLPGRQSYDTSPSYSWSPATTQQPGGSIARAYGRTKLYGNIIAGYIENTGTTGQNQIAHMLIDLGMGPYQRLYDFKLNDQPVGYYSGVTITERRGYLNQATIPAFNDTRLTRPVGAKVVNGTPVLRDTVGSDYDALEITLICPSGLWYANDAGGLDRIEVNVSVEISADAGATWTHVAVEPDTVSTVVPGYWSLGRWVYKRDNEKWAETTMGSSVVTDHAEGDRSGNLTWRWIDVPTTIVTAVSDSIVLGGNTRQPIRRTLRADNLTRGTQYKVRVINLTPDQTDSRYGDDVYLAEINEVMYDDYQYPRTVLAGVDALGTDQISGSIKFSCMAEAAIVRVWNGSAWSSQFSRNPAWVCWDILTQPVLDNSLNVVRYDGLDPSRLNLASFYAWAQFCDVQVPNGRGGFEARCCFDGVFDTPTTLWDAALEVCASARAQLVMRGTTISVVVDDVRTTPAQLFNVGNTNVNSFSETFLPIADRAASIEVNFLNADQDYQRDTLTVVNTAITEASAQRTPVGLRGVTRASQAWREAFFRLKRNELLKRSASISVDIDALACTVGDLIWVQNDVTQWGVGGRADVGSTTTQLKLDIPVTLAPATTYELKLRLSDDTLVTRTITTAAGTVTAVDVSEAFPSVPAQYDVWAIGEVNKAVKEFIVLDVKRDADQRAKLDLIEYNASLYGVDSGIPALPTPDVSINGFPAVDNVRFEELMELTAGGVVEVHLELHFDTTNAVRVDVYEDGKIIGESVSGTFRRNNVTSGQAYQFTLRPFSTLGVSPAVSWKSVSHSVIGKLTPPQNVTGFVATRNGNDIYFNWAKPAEIDIGGWEIRNGAAWDTAVVVGVAARDTRELKVNSAQGGTFLIKAFDTCAPEPNYSITAAQSIIASNEAINVVLTDDDATYGWGGTLTDMVKVGSVLNLAYALTWNDLTEPWSSYTTSWMASSGPLSAGSYVTDAHDIGAELTCNLNITPGLAVVALGQTWSSWILPWASYGNNYTWEGPLGVVTATYEIKTSLDGITWSDWLPFTSGLRTLRYYQLRASFTAQPGYQIEFDSFLVSVDVPDRIARFVNQTVPSGGLSLTFSPPFTQVKTIKVNLLDGLAGDRYTVSNKAVNGVDIGVYDNALSAKAGVVDVEVFGY